MRNCFKETRDSKETYSRKNTPLNPSDRAYVMKINNDNNNNNNNKSSSDNNIKIR